MVNTFKILLIKIIREIKSSWKQFIAIAFIAGLAVTLFTGLSANYLELEKRVDTLYDQTNIADIWTSVSLGDKENDITEINAITGGETEGRFNLSTELDGHFNSQVFVSESIPTISKPLMQSGEKPKIGDTTAKYFIIEETMLENINFERKKNNRPEIHLGDILDISFNLQMIREALEKRVKEIIPDFEMQEILDWLGDYVKVGGHNVLAEETFVFKATLTGTMLFPENVGRGSATPYSFLMSRTAFIDSIDKVIEDNYKTEAEIEGVHINLVEFLKEVVSVIPLVNQYVTTIGPKKNISQCKSLISDYFENDEDGNRLVMITDINNLPSNATIQNDITQAKQLTYIFPMIFFVVAILIVLTTISQIIIRERTQIGTMKAIGVPDGQILRHYMIMTMMVCAIGLLAGIIIGPLLIPFVMNQKYSILYSLPKMGYTFPLFQFLAVGILLLALAALVTWLVCRKEMKQLPSACMRPKEAKSLRGLRREKSAKTMTWRLAYRNIKKNFIKSLMVVVGVAGCTALLVCGFGIEDTINNGVNNDIKFFYSCDATGAYSSGSPSQINTIKTIEGVKGVEEYTFMPTQANFKETQYSTYSYIIPAASNFFKIEFPSDKLAVSQKVANSLNVKVGDKISYTVLGKTINGEIGVIFDAFYIHGIFAQESNPDESIKALSKTKTNCWITYNDYGKMDEINATIQESCPKIVSFTAVTSFIQQINDVISAIYIMTWTVKIFAILLAIVVLYNLALLNYKERLRDIATLKVLGFSRLEISKSLILEIMLLTVIGGLVGLALGQPFEILVLMVNETPLVSFLYTVKAFTYVLAIILTIGTALFVNAYLATLTKKIKMAESLKSVE